MTDDELCFLRTKLKQGEYGGGDIMAAWIAIDELVQARAALRLCHEHFAREITDDATMIDSDFGEAYRATVECLEPNAGIHRAAEGRPVE